MKIKNVLAAAAGLLLLESPVSGQNDAGSLRFLWWGSEIRKKATLEAMDVYQKGHPGLKMVGISQSGDQYETRLMVQIAGETQPEAMQIDPNWLPDFDASSLASFVDFRQETFDLSSFDPGILDKYCTVQGRLIGLPMGMNGAGLMVNKSVFAKFHLSPDTVWTWTKIRDEGRRIHQTDKSSYLLFLDSQGLSIGFFNDYLRSKNGRDWASEHGTLDCPPADLTEAFGFLKSLYENHAVVPLSEAMTYELKVEQSPMWRDGRVAMVPDWSGTMLKYKNELKPGTFGVARNIQVEGGADTRSVPTKPSMLLAIRRDSPSKAAALKFAQWFLTNPEAVSILKDVRSVPGSAAALTFLQERRLIDPDMVTLMAWANANPAPYNLVVNNGACRDLVRSLCEQVIYGNLTPEQATRRLVSGMNRLFAKLKLKE